MTTLRHGWRLSVILAVLALGTGCPWVKSPYARDPLMQNKRAIPGDADRVPALCASDHPVPPIPPTEESSPSITK
jgi:hypothetical protein